MQSQQKKVKWSRGETADALEERTDTGITQVSVSKMENIIADIYGNISRRPAFSVIKSALDAKDIPVISWIGSDMATDFALPPQSFVFTISANSYIIFIVNWSTSSYGGLLIENNKFVKKVKITNNTAYPLINEPGKIISAAQYNNFMIVSNLYTQDTIFRLTPENDVTVEEFKFTAPWYAPNGTQSKTVTTADIPNLEFNHDGQGFTAFAWTDNSGISSPYSLIDTGVDGDASQIEQVIPVGSIVKFPNLGCYMRVEGYNAGGSTVYLPEYTFDDTTVESHTSSGFCVDVRSITRMPTSPHNVISYKLRAYHDGNVIANTGEILANATVWVASSTAASGYRRITISGSTISWEDVPAGTLDIQMFGPLLTPVAAANEKDSTVTVETGYVSLDTYQPTKFTFSNQRLYASGFYNQSLSPAQIPGYVVGSQIARYNDFKNDYNTDAEAVVIDINTAYQEQVLHIIDYNGLKIFTDNSEYLYNSQNGIIKQSTNGALESCKPTVFGSVCLYADKSGNQIRAMQYELQTDLFTSSSINQMSKEDLVFNTTSIAGFLDKEHYTGRFLYATQFGYNRPNIYTDTPKANHSIAVCNMVPGNQAMIWSRWSSPEIKTATGIIRHTIPLAIEINNKVWFLMACYEHVSTYSYPGYTLVELNYENEMDTETEAGSLDTTYKITKTQNEETLYAWVSGANTVYTKSEIVIYGDIIYNEGGEPIATAENSPGGPNITIDGIGYYEWEHGLYTKDAIPDPHGSMTAPFDESRRLYDSTGTAYLDRCISLATYDGSQILYVFPTDFSVWPLYTANRINSQSTLQYTITGTTYNATYTEDKNIYANYATTPGATVSVFDGDEYKWDDTLDANGNYTKPLTDIEHPRVGFKINAELVSHPIDVGGKTYTDHKRIGKCVAVVRDTEAGAFTICDKTGYMDNDKKKVNFYGCTGMKDEVRYTIKNINGAKFTIESLTMIIEYATLDS